MLDASASGVYVIAPTPFHDDGRIDERSTDRMTDFFLESGVTGITVLGQMGEAPKLDHGEAVGVAARVIRRAKVPVIVGVSAPGFAAMRGVAREVMEAGAAGVMIAPPPALRTDDQIVTYYRQAVEAIGAEVPFVIQDYPLTFSVVMTCMYDVNKVRMRSSTKCLRTTLNRSCCAWLSSSLPFAPDSASTICSRGIGAL